MIDNFTTTAIRIAKEAGKLLLEYEDNVLSITDKVIGYDFVTDVDTTIQKLIKTRLFETFPDHECIGEEDNLSDSEISKILRSNPDIFYWIVDPLDGTLNYIQHLSEYGVSIGLVQNNEIICGVIYLPRENELFYAQKGKGAYLNGKKIEVSQKQKLSQAFIVTGISNTNMIHRKQMVDSFNDLFMSTMNVRMYGCAVKSIASFAAGRFDCYFELGPHPWDVVAGIIIATEAGGEVCTLDGRPYILGDQSFMVVTKELKQQFLDAGLSKIDSEYV